MVGWADLVWEHVTVLFSRIYNNKSQQPIQFTVYTPPFLTLFIFRLDT